MSESASGGQGRGVGTTTLTSGFDLFGDVRGKPVLSNAGHTKRYVGRVVIELWEPVAGDPEDDRFLAFSADAVDGNHEALAKRVARGFQARVLTQRFR